MSSCVLTYSEIDKQQWAALVKQSKTGNWFQSSEAYDFYASLPEMLRPFVCAVSGDGKLAAVCVGYVTQEHYRIKQFFTRRAIIVGGPCLADDCINEDVSLLLSTLRQRLSTGANAPIYIETRNFNDYSRWKSAFVKAGFEYMQHLNFHIHCADENEMWNRLSETRHRQIRKAIATGVRIEETGTEQDVKDWYRILENLYRTKVKRPLFPIDFFLAFHRKGLGKYLFVKYEGKVIGGIMCPIMQGRCIYEWFVCGLDVEYKNQYPSVMATWAAMQYANGHGIPMFDIMGAGQPNVPYGVRNFKAEFGGTLMEHGRFLYVVNPLLFKIGTLGVKIQKQW